MKAIFALFVIASAVAPALSQAVPTAQEPCMHVETSFDLVLPASYAVVAPLFGPEGERAWAGKHWDPAFIHPLPAKDVEGAVFTIRHGPYNAVWVNTLFDVTGRHYQYVYFLADLMVTVIDVRFNPVGEASTAVHVSYTRTAITSEGNEHVKALSEGDKAAGPDWQKAIEEFLHKTQPAAKP
jgi:hypothetical protein